MIKELIVHLGDTKTGSTSIQRALLQKAYEIKGASICYPTENHHNALVRTLIRKRRLAERGNRFSRLYNTLHQSDADYGIVSAEHFQFVDPEVFAGAIAEFWPGFEDKMRLVAYVRPHPDKLLSSFSERVKLGMVSKDFESFAGDIFEGTLLDYLPRFQKWRSVFGDRFTLRPFVRKELHSQDAVADFFRFVLGHEGFKISGDTSANPSLTVQQLALLRRAHWVLDNVRETRSIDMRPQIFEARSTFGRSVSEHIGAHKLGADGGKLRLPESLVAKVQKRYMADAEALDRAFFSGQPMSEALQGCGVKATTQQQELEAEAYFDQQTIAAYQAMVEIMAKMLVRRPKRFLRMVADTRLMFETVGE